MQKLQVKLKNVPKGVYQAPCSTSLQLNKEETLSVAGIVRTCNNLDGNLLQQAGGLKAAVFVLSSNGKPLMPCTSSKARKLLQNRKAKVVKLYPFTIRLNFDCENQTQDISMGIDAGYANIGFSCITTKSELVSGTIILDNKTSERLTERRMYRRGRRNKLWYREPRFDNRKRKEGSLPPSVQRRYDTNLKIINLMKSLMPITKVTVEVANFDIQKIENEAIEGVGYQQGEMLGYQNMRSYLMAREKGVCQLCGKEFEKGNPSHIHHIIERANGGTDRAKNLAILHEKCHDKLHKKGLKLKPNKTYKPNTFMSIIRNRFWNDIPNINVTYGYETFVKRIELRLEKTHYTDAFVIAGGEYQQRCKPIGIKQKHQHNRVLQVNRKGFAPAIRKQRYKIQPKDLVWINGKREVAVGVHCKGAAVIIERNKKSFLIKKVEKIYNFGTFAYS